jgi:hypothetical protein
MYIRFTKRHKRVLKHTNADMLLLLIVLILLLHTHLNIYVCSKSGKSFKYQIRFSLRIT